MEEGENNSMVFGLKESVPHSSEPRDIYLDPWRDRGVLAGLPHTSRPRL